MKNEDRIVELLTDMLIKQDQHSEILVSQSSILEKQGQILERLADGQERMNNKIDNLTHQFDRLAEVLTHSVLDRIIKLEDEVTRLKKKVE